MVLAEKTIILIPTFNEKENISRLIPEILKIIPSISILVIDDNSPDGTAGVVEKLSLQYPRVSLLKRLQNHGLGRSYIDGFNSVLHDFNYEHIVTMDADFSHDPKVIPAMLIKLNDSDLVIGSRYIRGGRIANWHFKRKILSRFANYYVRLILGLSVRDLTTGFTAFRKTALKRINLTMIRSDGYAFLVELKYRMIKNGGKFIEQPIVFNERREGQSKMSAKVIWESIWLPWRLRIR